MEAVRFQEQRPFSSYQTYLIGGTVDIGNSGIKLATTHTVIDQSAAGDLTIITPTSTKKLRLAVLQLKVEGGDNTILVKQATATRIPASTIPGGASYTYNCGQWPIKFTTAGEALVINFSTAERVTGFAITYEE